jgi:hypothetical protein
MPRQSYTEREFSLSYQERTGRKVELNPPKSLVTAVQRDAYRELLFRHPELTTKRHFEGAVANYVLLQDKIRRLDPSDYAAVAELMRGILVLEEFLGLPASPPPSRRTRVVGSPAPVPRGAVDYEIGIDGAFHEPG